MGEKQSRYVGSGTPEHREFEQPAFVDSEAALEEAAQHRPDEGAPRFRKRDEHDIGMPQPRGVAQISPHAPGPGAGNQLQRLDRNSVDDVARGHWLWL